MEQKQINKKFSNQLLKILDPLFQEKWDSEEQLNDLPNKDRWSSEERNLIEHIGYLRWDIIYVVENWYKNNQQKDEQLINKIGPYFQGIWHLKKECVTVGKNIKDVNWELIESKQERKRSLYWEILDVLEKWYKQQERELTQ